MEQETTNNEIQTEFEHTSYDLNYIPIMSTMNGRRIIIKLDPFETTNINHKGTSKFYEDDDQ